VRYNPVSLLPNDPFRKARSFKDTAWFIKGILSATSVVPGSVVDLHTIWVSTESTSDPRRIFVHLVDTATGKIIAQHDGLDSPARFWDGQNEIVQVHKLLIPKNTPPGKYEMRIGMYDPITGVRVPLGLIREQDGPDHIVLGTIEVTR
jgi:hypothetical protein